MKTPEQIAAENKRGKKRYSLYLSQVTMDYISERAIKAGIKPSAMVDTILRDYVKALKDIK